MQKDNFKEKRIKEQKLKRKRTEFIKSVFIALLFFNLVMLLYSISKESWLFEEKTNLTAESGTALANDNSEAINLYFSYAAPEYVLLNTETGRDIFYTDSDTYLKTQKILQDVDRSLFSSYGKFEKGEDIFTDIKDRNLVYISYPYHRFPKLAGQMFENPSSKLSEVISSFKKLILLPAEKEEDGIFAYIKDEKTNEVFKMQTSVPSSGLYKLLDSVKRLDDKLCTFSYELNLNSLKENTINKKISTYLRPDIIIPSKSQYLPNIEMTPPEELEKLNLGFTKEGISSKILNSFGFKDSYTRQYINGDNTLVCVSDNATLKLSPDGILEYSAVSKKGGVNLMGSTRLSIDNSYFLSFTGVSRIINTVMPLADNNEKTFKIRLTDLQAESFEVAEYKFMFDYYLNGTRIIPGLYHAIEATTVDGYLTSMRIDLKTFKNTNEKSAIQPLISAIDKFCADKKTEGAISVSECIRCYIPKDGKSLFSVGWLVK